MSAIFSLTDIANEASKEVSFYILNKIFKNLKILLCSHNLCCENLHLFYRLYHLLILPILKTIWIKQSIYGNYWNFMQMLCLNISCLCVLKNHASCLSYTWAKWTLMLRAALWQNFPCRLLEDKLSFTEMVIGIYFGR